MHTKHYLAQEMIFGVFHKACFHIHTPASHDYTLLKEWTSKEYQISSEKEIYEICLKRNVFLGISTLKDFQNLENFPGFTDTKEVLSYLLLAYELLTNEIEIAVIADHNNIKGLEKIRLAIEKLYEVRPHFYSIYTEVISAIEISCADRNHVVVMFDDKNRIEKFREINGWLEEKLMSEEAGTFLTSHDVISHFNELGDMAYIAHINTSDMFKNFNEAYKKTIFEKNKYNLIGVSKRDEISNMTRMIKGISGKEVNVILDNDSHNIDDIYVNVFWIKGHKCNFNLIKEALIDFDISISLNDESVNNKDFIKGIYIENPRDGFLCGGKEKTNAPLSLKFSDSLNCIIGGRGTGKSTILNILEFVLSGVVSDIDKLEFICKQGNIWLLYQYKKTEYLIRLGVPTAEGVDHIMERFGQKNKYEHSSYKFNKSQVEKHVLNERITIYKIITLNQSIFSAEKVIPKERRELMQKFFNIGYSVNELVHTASSDRISSFIESILFENKNINKAPKPWKIITLKGLERKLKEIDRILLEIKNVVTSVIDKFNLEQNKILRVKYHQNPLNYKLNIKKGFFL